VSDGQTKPQFNHCDIKWINFTFCSRYVYSCKELVYYVSFFWNVPILNLINIPVSLGELVDKITILEIKKYKSKCVVSKSYISKELDALNNVLSEVEVSKKEIIKIKSDLFDVNTDLWKLEDEIRLKGKENKFDDGFKRIAFNIYKKNDCRFNLKNKLNLLSSSEFREVKIYD